MSLPKLPARAAYLTINNAAKRNALSIAVLRDLKAQLIKHNTSPVDNKARFLPPFKPSILNKLESILTSFQHNATSQAAIPESPSSSPSTLTSSPPPPEPQTSTPNLDISSTDDLNWLLSTPEFNRHRRTLPRVLVLRSPGPTFSSGHDLKELSRLSHAEVKETFALCAQVMTLIRRSPIPILSTLAPKQLATAAGAQLALTADLRLAGASAALQLPGQNIGIPCTSPAAIVSRVLGPGPTFRMLACGEPVRADELFGLGRGGAVEVVQDDALDERVDEVINRMVGHTAAMPQALGKWAFWTQFGMNGAETGGGGDGYENAVGWAGRVMALHARADDAKEGVDAFFGKRPAIWRT